MAQGNQEVVLERKQAVMLGAGVVIVLILVFVLGVLFGRNIANRKALKEQSQVAQKALTSEPPKPVPSGTTETPTLAQGETSIQKKIDQQKPPEPKPAKGDTVNKGTKPGAKETVKPGTKPAGKEVAQGATVKPTGKETPKTPTKEAKTPETKPAATKEATTKKPETKPAETKPKETAPAPTKTSPAIQVASYPDKASAVDLVKKLKANKWPAYDEATEIPKKGTYYRVYLGPYSSKDQAAKALVIFKNKEPKYKDAFVRK